MSIAVVRTALLQGIVPSGWSRALQALWHLDRGDWECGHQLAQAQNAPDAAWVHAHLHRVGGNLANARRWYRCAGREPAMAALDAEGASIAAALLNAVSAGACQ